MNVSIRKHVFNIFAERHHIRPDGTDRDINPSGFPI